MPASASLIAEIDDRLRTFKRTGEAAVVLDPQAVVTAAALLRQAVPLPPFPGAPVPGDLDAADLVARLYVARHTASGSPPEMALANALFMLIDQVLPGGMPEPIRSALAELRERGAPRPSAREAWNAQAEVLFHAYVRTGQPELIRTAVSMGRQVLAATPVGDPRRPVYLTSLGTILATAFEHDQDPADLAQATQILQAAVDAMAVRDPHRGALLAVLAGALQQRALRLRSRPGLDEAIGYAQAAVDLLPDGHPALATSLSGLCAAFEARFGFSGATEDLDHAIAAGRSAVAATPPASPEAVECLANLAIALASRFEQSGDLADLDEAIDLDRAALSATLDDEPYRYQIESELCGLLLARYENSDAPEDLDQAIEAGRAALAGMPADGPGRPAALGNLCGALRVRYEAVGAQADVDEAVAVGREAVESAPADDPQRWVFLSNLGLALQARSERTTSPSDLDEAIACLRGAVRAMHDGHPARAGILSNVSAALRERFERTQESRDLDDAVAVGQAAVAATPRGHPGLGMHQSNLSLALRVRFGRTADPADLEAAFQAALAAEAMVPAAHPGRALVLINLGLICYDRSGQDHLPAAERADRLRQARQALRQAATSPTAMLSTRLHAAAAWGEAAAELGDWPDAVRGYAMAVELLVRLAWAGLDRGDRLRILANYLTLGADAFASALRAGDPATAIELLEQARGVLLADAIEARTDRGALVEIAPELADRMDAIRAELDRPDLAPAATRHPERRRDLAREWDGLVAQARELPGLGDFLGSSPAADLRRCAAGGPVAIVNISRHGSHALILTTDELTAVPLEQVAFADALKRVDALQAALDALDDSEAGQLHAQQVLDQTLDWLEEAIVTPVAETLAALPAAPPAPATKPHPATAPHRRLWWCPVGPAAFLPLHAASDRWVCSYTPTLRALIEARTRAARTAGAPGRMLAVALPETPGLSELPQAGMEVEQVTRFAPGATVLTGRRATRARLLADLPGHSFLHFAGHGLQNPNDLASGALYTYDHQEEGPITLSDLAQLRLTDARLAFLSACEAAVGSYDAPDEAIHLAGSLLAAGFTHVIATQWTVFDTIAPQVAEGFYARLSSRDDRGETHLDPARSAHVLHDAIGRLRLRDRYPSLLWAPYLHIGP
jgi:tetratricopeptide (TPR) repeat protein